MWNLCLIILIKLHQLVLFTYQIISNSVVKSWIFSPLLSYEFGHYSRHTIANSDCSCTKVTSSICGTRRVKVCKIIQVVTTGGQCSPSVVNVIMTRKCHNSQQLLLLNNDTEMDLMLMEKTCSNVTMSMCQHDINNTV